MTEKYCSFKLKGMPVITFDQILKIGEIIITFSGFWVAYVVFALQAKTFASQQEISKLEYKKFLYQIRPWFINPNPKNNQPNGNSILINFEIVLTKNVAHDFSMENLTKIKLKYYTQTDPLPIFSFDRSIPIIKGVFEKDEIYQEVVIKIKFRDEVGTQYFQKIHGALGDLVIDPPIMMETKK